MPNLCSSLRKSIFDLRILQDHAKICTGVELWTRLTSRPLGMHDKLCLSHAGWIACQTSWPIHNCHNHEFRYTAHGYTRTLGWLENLCGNGWRPRHPFAARLPLRSRYSKQPYVQVSCHTPPAMSSMAFCQSTVHIMLLCHTQLLQKSSCSQTVSIMDETHI